jgi:hypothetical protein
LTKTFADAKLQVRPVCLQYYTYATGPPGQAVFNGLQAALGCSYFYHYLNTLKKVPMKLAVGLFLVVIATQQTARAFVLPHRHHHYNPSFSCTSLLFARRVPRVVDTSSSTGPKGPRRGTSTREPQSPKLKRAPHQFDHTLEEARPFVNALQEIQLQDSNDNAPVYELSNSTTAGDIITQNHIETFSLNDLFPNLDFSHKFATSTAFREDLRNSIRQDIFDTTPTYHGMSEKAKAILLLPDSSLQGSWKCQNGGWSRANNDDNLKRSRMNRLTAVLQQHLGDGAPTGDAFMDTIGKLCGRKPSTHLIDIVGVLTRRIPHSWHQDTGNSPENSKTVLLGFPPTDNYNGVGVFSHVVKLKREQFAQDGHSPMEPVLYKQDIDDEYIVRPKFAEGQEIIAYRDVHVLHSSPDVAYRTSVMRFM